MKKIALLLPVFLLLACFSFAQAFISFDVIIGKRQPTPTEQGLMATEEALHPNITQSMHDIERAMAHLNEAPENFGGHKQQAMDDLRRAWISLRKALYFRIWQDTGR